MLKGLQYVGNGNGILVMLYKSYKTVEVAWNKPYQFTNKDNVSDEARKYYLKNYRPLGVKLVEEIDADTDPSKISEFNPNDITASPVKSDSDKVEGVAKEPEKEVDLLDESNNSEVIEPTITGEVESSDVNEETSNISSTSLDDILSDVRSSYDREIISNLTALDLGSILDEKLDDNQVKELSSRVGYDYGRTRSKSKIVSGLVESKLSDVINLILG